MDQTYLYYMERMFQPKKQRNFATQKDKYEIVKTTKREVENHWFIKDKDFNVRLLYNGKVRYYYLLDDRGIDHIYGKSALYFKVKKNDMEEIPVFLGFDTSNDTNGIGIFLGGQMSYKDMGENFDYAMFAQNYYTKIKDIRKELRDYGDFAPWVITKLKDVIQESLLHTDVKYEYLLNPDPWDFVHIRGLDSVDFSVGLFNGDGGKRYIDNNIILELIGYRLFAAKKNLYKFCFNEDFICAAYEKAFSYIEAGKFGSVDEVPEHGYSEKEQTPVYNMEAGETTELGYGAQFVEHIRLDGLSATWNNHLKNPDSYED